MHHSLESVEDPRPRLLLAVDKFRGTASARALTTALERGLEDRDVVVDAQPLSDGGEGFADAFRGEVVEVVVPGALGEAVRVPLVLHPSPRGLVGVFSVAHVVGHDARRPLTPDEALAARSDGVGFAILEAVRFGASAVLVGCGGSVTSDGGLGCYEVLRGAGGLSVPVSVAADVTTDFAGARRFAVQKGVATSDLTTLDQRLRALRARYLVEGGRDVGELRGAGAAGGIAGALAALGADVVDGFTVVAHAVGLVPRVRDAAVVVTGEGRFDAGSLEGKVTVKVAELVTRLDGLLVVGGAVEPEAARRFDARFVGATIVSLEQRFGAEAARLDVAWCLQRVVEEFLSLHGL